MDSKHSNKIIAEKIKKIIMLNAWNPSTQEDGLHSLHPDLTQNNIKYDGEKISVFFYGECAKESTNYIMQQLANVLETPETLQNIQTSKGLTIFPYYENGDIIYRLNIKPEVYDQEKITDGLNTLIRFSENKNKDISTWTDRLVKTCGENATEIDYIKKYLEQKILTKTGELTKAYYDTNAEPPHFVVELSRKRFRKTFGNVLNTIRDIFDNTPIKKEANEQDIYKIDIIGSPIELFAHIMGSDQTFVEKLAEQEKQVNLHSATTIH